MTIGSLFSGICGLELGLEWAGLGPVKWQVEIDGSLRESLRKRWPSAKLYGDIRDVYDFEPVDIICGGFPCQDLSTAGKKAGLSGARSGLWSEMERVIKTVRPSWVVVENVALGAPKWVDDIRLALEREGYESIPIPLAAIDLGACHERKRVFVVAHTDRPHVWKQPRRWSWPRRKSSSKSSESRDYWETIAASQGLVEPRVCRADDGLSNSVDRIRALGNAVVPQCAEVIGEVIKLLMDR